MPTLQEILEGDLEQPSMNKEASQNISDENISDEIEKLAMEIGLVDEDDTASVAGAQNNQGQSKEAKMGLDALYGSMFPEDVQEMSGSTEKVASMNKEAAEIEEAMGQAAYNAFQAHVDQMITKIAADHIEGGATVDVEHHADSEPSQAMDNNKPADSAKPISTKPVVDNELPAENGGAVVGTEKQQHAPMGEMKMAAYRKHLLLSQMGK